MIHRLFRLSVLLLVVSACAGGSQTEDQNTDAATSTAEATESQDQPQEVVEKPAGLVLIETSDCVACHKEKDQLVGPSYAAIAERYKDNFAAEKSRLVQTILEGGYGVWGEVPMTPHPQHTEEEAETMVTYIMSLGE